MDACVNFICNSLVNWFFIYFLPNIGSCAVSRIGLWLNLAPLTVLIFCWSLSVIGEVSPKAVIFQCPSKRLPVPIEVCSDGWLRVAERAQETLVASVPVSVLLCKYWDFNSVKPPVIWDVGHIRYNNKTCIHVQKCVYNEQNVICCT